jgi:hypothetical protein
MTKIQLTQRELENLSLRRRLGPSEFLTRFSTRSKHSKEISNVKGESKGTAGSHFGSHLISWYLTRHIIVALLSVIGQNFIGLLNLLKHLIFPIILVRVVFECPSLIGLFYVRLRGRTFETQEFVEVLTHSFFLIVPMP